MTEEMLTQLAAHHDNANEALSQYLHALFEIARKNKRQGLHRGRYVVLMGCAEIIKNLVSTLSTVHYRIVDPPEET